MTPWADAVVIGGGIAGACSALALANAGARVVLAEPGPLNGAATDASAGMLAAQVEISAGDPQLALALEGRAAHRRLHEALPMEMVHRIGMHPGGILHVALSESECEHLQGQCEAQRDLGLRAEWLDADDLRRHHSGLGQAVLGGMLARDDGWINSAALAAALRAAAVIRGAVIVTAPATTVLSRNGRVSGVRTAAGTWRTRWAVLAAGAWSPAIAGLPRTLPIKPVRGQMFSCALQAGWNGPVLFGPRGYVVPRDDLLLLGATMEDAGFDHSTTPAGLAAVRAGCAELLPELAATPARHSWAGLRPVTPDGRPILGTDPDLEGLVYATGHGRNGILLGPVTGEIVTDIVVRGGTTVALEPYGIQRFTEV